MTPEQRAHVETVEGHFRKTFDIVAYDLETALVAPGLLAPPPVCGSLATAEGTRLLTFEELAVEMPRMLREARLIIGANVAYDFGILVAYGYVTVEEVFKAYREGRVFDIQIAQALDAIAGGHLYKDPATGGPIYVNGKQSPRYSLEACVQLTLGRSDAKANDFWRLRYDLLRTIPFDKWPHEAKQYPLDDSQNTFDVGLRQLGLKVVDGQIVKDPEHEPYKNLHDMKRQARAAWCLHLAAMWGLRTDPTTVEAFEKEALAREAKLREKFTGIFLRPDGSAEQAKVKKATAIAYGAVGACKTCGGSGKVPSEKTNKPITCKVVGGVGCDGTGLDLGSSPTLPRTDTGGVKADRDTLMESGDELLYEYGESGEKDYTGFLKNGTKWPINPRHNVIVETGRTSSDLQQLPKVGGVRESFVGPLVSVDYAAVELCTLAQVIYWLFGRSTMRDVINKSGDPGALHTALGARLMGITFEEMNKRKKSGDKVAAAFRQAAKPIGFGAPGGMGEATIVLTNRKKIVGTTKTPDGAIEYAGIRFCILIGGADRCGVRKVTEWKNKPIPPTCLKCIECARDIREQWFTQWPEMKEYFAYVAAQADGVGEVKQFVSNRIRGGINFTAAANGFFQGLAADGAKDAFWEVMDEAHCNPESVMFGLKAPNFVHDEIVGDLRIIPPSRWHEASYRMSDVMKASMQRIVPDVTISCAPALMWRLSKDAVEAFDKGGRLICWEDACQACLFDDEKKHVHSGVHCRKAVAA